MECNAARKHTNTQTHTHACVYIDLSANILLVFFFRLSQNAHTLVARTQTNSVGCSRICYITHWKGKTYYIGFCEPFELTVKHKRRLAATTATMTVLSVHPVLARVIQLNWPAQSAAHCTAQYITWHICVPLTATTTATTTRPVAATALTQTGSFYPYGQANTQPANRQIHSNLESHEFVR